MAAVARAMAWRQWWGGWRWSLWRDWSGGEGGRWGGWGGGGPGGRAGDLVPPGPATPAEEPAAAAAVELPGPEPYPEGQYVYCQWPGGLPSYPNEGEPGSFYELQRFAENAGCKLRIAGKETKRRQRKATLTVKGLNAWDVFKHILRVTRVLPGFDFGKARWRACGRCAMSAALVNALLHSGSISYLQLVWW